MEFSVQDYLNAKQHGLPFAGKPLTPSSLRKLDYLFRLVEDLLGRSAASMDVADVETLMKRLSASKVSDETTNGVISAVRGLFEWGINSDLIDSKNPMKAVSAKTIHAKVQITLREKDVLAIADKIEEMYRERREAASGTFGATRWAAIQPEKKYALAVKTMYYGGLRISEVCTIRKADLTEDGVVVFGKGGKERFVLLLPALVEELRAYADSHDSDWLFPGAKPSAHMSAEAFSGAFRDASIALGYTNGREITPHTLRRSFATEALGKTGDLAFVQDMLGHSSPITTRRYAQVKKDHAKRAYDKIWKR